MSKLYNEILNLKADEVSIISENRYVNLSSSSKALDKSFIRNILGFSNGQRVNLFSPELDSILFKFEEPLISSYSWYLMVRDPQMASDPVPFVIRYPSLSFQKRNHSNLSSQEREYIKKRWVEQYINVVHRARSNRQKKDLIDSLEITLSEGTHLLYWSGNTLIGHGSYVEDYNPVLKLDNHYLHLWVEQSQNSDIRKNIIQHFFNITSTLNSHSIGGIAVNNTKSIRMLLKSGFVPKMLSIEDY